MRKLWLYLKNWGFLLDMAFMTLLGFDPRMTISAYCYRRGWLTVCRVINWLKRDPQHCQNAAQGWDDPRIVNRSLW